MFLLFGKPIGKRYKTFSALHQFFLKLLIIWAQVVANCIFANLRWWLFKIKKECPAPQ
jgi:hypothetical protein